MCKCEEIIEIGKSGGDVIVASSLASYPNSLRIRFQATNKDVYIAAGNYEEMAK